MSRKVPNRIVAIGGGELRAKETNSIDKYIANLAKERAGERRANALFFPTASHDSLPYFNTFRKTYTSDFGLKADVALLTKKNIPYEKIVTKIEAADMIYIGGGDTAFMLDVWKKTGIDKLIYSAYQRGVILAGLSAGAICWFEQMYTDSFMLRGEQSDYAVLSGLGWVTGFITPHYNERQEEFDALILSQAKTALAIENNAAILLENGTLVGALSSGGSAFRLTTKNNKLHKEKIPLLEP
ncbi:MAG: peptidase E [Clostridia bacterium]